MGRRLYPPPCASVSRAPGSAPREEEDLRAGADPGDLEERIGILEDLLAGAVVLPERGEPGREALRFADDGREAAAREQAQAIADEIVVQGGPEGLAEKQIVALIAYLQRLGTDITKPEPIAIEEEIGPSQDTAEEAAVDAPAGEVPS